MLNFLSAFWPISYKILQLYSFWENVPNITYLFIYFLLKISWAFSKHFILIEFIWDPCLLVQWWSKKHLKGLSMTSFPALLDLCKRWDILHKLLASCPMQESGEAPATSPPSSVRRREREIFYPEEHELSCIDMLLWMAAVGRHKGRSPMNNQKESGKVPSSDKKVYHLKN